MTGQTPLLEVADLKVHYPARRRPTGALSRQPRHLIRAVDGVSLHVDRGEMVALVGESGCGKTTTALAILRMIEPASGVIRFKGHDITALGAKAMRPLRRGIQMVYQDPYESLDPRFRVRDTVAEPLFVHRSAGTRQRRTEQVNQVLSRVDLTPAESYLDRYPHELSGGQRQRVAIAAALVLAPQLLIADEPVSMLDVSVRTGVLRLFDDLRRTHDMGIFMITHDLSTVAHFADRIAVMYRGRIVEEGPTHNVLHNPQHPYTQALISAIPRRHPGQRGVRQLLQDETPDPISIESGCRFQPRCPLAHEACRATDPSLRPARGAKTPRHQAACILRVSPSTPQTW